MIRLNCLPHIMGYSSHVTDIFFFPQSSSLFIKLYYYSLPYIFSHIMFFIIRFCIFIQAYWAMWYILWWWWVNVFLQGTCSWYWEMEHIQDNSLPGPPSREVSTSCWQASEVDDTLPIPLTHSELWGTVCLMWISYWFHVKRC